MINIIILLIAESLKILQAQMGSNVSVNIAESLVSIMGKAMTAYQLQTGKPIDPSLIKPYEPI